MPRLDNSGLEEFNLPTGNFGFSAERIADLGSSEYTLVSIIVDDSGSVAGFKTEMEKFIVVE